MHHKILADSKPEDMNKVFLKSTLTLKVLKIHNQTIHKGNTLLDLYSQLSTRSLRQMLCGSHIEI